jgi:ligand-binding sensor domain-containing protein
MLHCKSLSFLVYLVMWRSRFILLIACLGICLLSLAQQYPFVNYTPRDGLVGNKVRFISQDSKGKLYFGTSNGLSIYDGSRFTNYSTENGLFTNLVNGVVELGNDSLLVIVNGNKLQYLYNGKIRNMGEDAFCPVVNNMVRCSSGEYYALSDDGLFRFEKDRYKRIPVTGLPDSAKNLSHATELDSFLIINSDVVNPAYRAPKFFIVYNYHSGKAVATCNGPDIYCSIKTARNELLLATNKGILTLDRAALSKGEIKLSPYSGEYKIPPGITTGLLYLDKQQNLWLSTINGVMKIPVKGENQLFSEENGFPHNGTSCIFQDREGIMWFGGALTGAAKLVDQQLQFFKTFKPGFHARDVYIPAGSDSVWMYDDGSRRLLLLHNNSTQEFTVTGNQYIYSVIMGRHKMYASDGRLVYLLKPSSKQTFSLSLLYATSATDEGTGSIFLDSQENPLLVGMSVKVLLPGNKVVSQPLDYFANKAVLKNDVLYVVTRSMHIYIYKLHPSDPSNYLQLIAHFDEKAKNMGPRSLAVDDSGRLWIGTREAGLLCYTITNGEVKPIKQLTVKDGLTENFIRLLEYDPAGYIWAGTPTGLDKITLHNDGVSIENVTKASNMYPDMQKLEIDKHGVLWATSSSGLMRVYPSKKQAMPVTPQILFTRCTAANKELPLDQDGITLKHFQNNLSFQVAAPSFFDEKKTLFSFKLQENESDKGEWTEPSSQAEISFLNLPPGHYRLKVKAVFPNGKYPPLEAGYFFNILIPWWHSWWFRGFVVIAVLLLVVLLFRLYYRNKLQQQKISLEKKQAIEKERTRIAIDMHDDMGAGLSRIKVLSETIKFENLKGIINPAHLHKISVYSEEMMDKMGEIVWALNQRNDSFNDLTSYMRAYAVDYLTNHDIHCSFHATSDPGETFISGEVRRNIFLAVKEALHNVVKHAQATNVDITITRGKELSILIHDNGKGIEWEKMSKFGNGLNNIRKRMTEIGGLAEFRNENGTSVMLRLPKGI